MNRNGLEPSDPNTKFANAARTTTPTHSLPNAQNSCSSAPDGAPILGTSRPFPSPTCQATGCSDELLQRGLLGPTACSHFLVSGPQRNKHSTARERGRFIHNNVLKAKPTICRVRHILGTAWPNQTSVSTQDHHSTTSISHSTCNENPEDFAQSHMTPCILIPHQ